MELIGICSFSRKSLFVCQQGPWCDFKSTSSNILVLPCSEGHCQNEDKDAKSATEEKPKEKVQTGKGAGKKTKTSTAKQKKKQPAQSSQGAYLTQVVNKGKFQRVGDTLSVPAGETLELRCKGAPVQWAVPYYLEEEDAGRLK